jgi:predicted CopG family antitoxin
MEKATTQLTEFIRVTGNVKSMLDKLKVHQNQSYNEVIHKLILDKKGEEK